MDINTALEACAEMKIVRQRLHVLQSLGLGYLTLGEATPSLSGGEAQRLKLASEMGRGQSDSVFVFDEPTIGLHPLDVRTLLGVFQTLIESGATVIVIEHDLDVIRNADYIVDMGPGGGAEGGRAVCGSAFFAGRASYRRRSGGSLCAARGNASGGVSGSVSPCPFLGEGPPQDRFSFPCAPSVPVFTGGQDATAALIRHGGCFFVPTPVNGLSGMVLGRKTR